MEQHFTIKTLESKKQFDSDDNTNRKSYASATSVSTQGYLSMEERAA